LDQNFLHMYKQLTGKSALSAFSGSTKPVDSFIAGLLDDSYVVVLNDVLDSLNGELQSGQSPNQAVLSPATESAKAVKSQFSNITVDMHQRLNEFVLTWDSRLKQEALLPYLQSTEWVIEQNGKFLMRIIT
jgi:hypothetical protein